MIFDFDPYVIDVDVEKTADYHHNDSRIACDCLACQNFYRHTADFPQEIRRFLEQLGVDPVKPQVLSVDYAPSKETMRYSGFYYLCGTILPGKDARVQEAQKYYRFNDACLMSICDDYAVYFSEPKRGIVDMNFPKPIVEIQFICTLPWVMPDPHYYHTHLGDNENA